MPIHTSVSLALQLLAVLAAAFTHLEQSALFPFLPVFQVVGVCLCFAKAYFPAGFCVGWQQDLVSDLAGKNSMPIRPWHISQSCSQRPLAALCVVSRDVTH